ncbi:acyltransferase [Amycolatopsis sp. CA-230715]|uniref:acyltransferase n=1 Tax=Amycolatopsis sp. CA-230715 TaxID=2745196 RepID=UPI001C0207EB|nr:acyltransferase [Amycolatopsis sp. CA-230715]QWF84534.1 hypothetical protein HUW46_07984 [Amycolatopsis sp. CA-230715]
MDSATRVIKAGRASGAVVRCGLIDSMTIDMAVVATFFYDRTLDVDRLADGLSRALDLVPVFGGRIRGDTASAEIVCSDSGVPMTVTEVDRTLADTITLAGAFGYPSEPTGAGELPLLAIRVSRLADGGTVVGCSWNHTVGDTHSFMLLMRAWSACVDGGEIPAVDIVDDRDAFLDRVLPPQGDVAADYTEIGPGDAEGIMRRLSSSAAQPTETVQLAFTEAEVARLRDALRVKAGRWLSASDAVSAHVLTSLAGLEDPPKARDLTVPVNIRRPLGLSASVIGNLLGKIELPYAPDISPERLAASLRGAIEGYPVSHLNLRANLEFLAKPDRRFLQTFVPTAVLSERPSTVLTNWAGFGAYDITFDGNRPRFFSPRGDMAFPWMGLLSEGPDRAGLICTIGVPEYLAARLRTPGAGAAMHRYRADHDAVSPLVPHAL